MRYDRTAAVDRIDHTKPCGAGNMAFVHKELLNPVGDGELVQHMQNNVQAALLAKDSEAASRALDALLVYGHPRNFLAAIGLLQRARETGSVPSDPARPFDEASDGKLLDDLVTLLNIPREIFMNPQTLLSVSISACDPLLMMTAIDAGADVNELYPITPLANARARGHHALASILLEHGARDPA